MSNDLASLVTEDSRLPVEKLRRCQLWGLAESQNINYPPGAAKVDMLKILDANGVDLSQPLNINGVQWHTTQGQDSEGKPHQEITPISAPHQTSHQDIDYGGVMARKAKTRNDAEGELFEESRLEVLERELKSLKSSALDFPLDKLLPWQLNHMCQNKGIDPKGMDKDQMIAALGVGDGQDTTERGQ